MNYKYQYDIAALFISGIILLNFLFKKRVSTKISTAFAILAGDLVFTTIMDLVTIFTISYYDRVPVGLNYILNVIALISYNLLPLFFYYSVYSATTEDNAILLSKDKFPVLIPIAISLILILTSPLTDFIIYFEESGVYRAGKYFDILSIVGFVYLIMVIIRAVRKRKRLNRLQLASIILYTVTNLMAIVIQSIFTDVIITLFFASLTILLVYLTLDNPADYLDQVMDIYNKKAFIVTMDKYFARKKQFKIICVQLEGISYLNDTIGYENFNNMLCIIRDELSNVCGRKNLFRISGSKFALFFEDNGSIINRLHSVKEIFNQTFDINGINITLRFKMTTIMCPKEAQTSESAIDLLTYTLESPNAGVGIVTKADNMLLEKSKRENKLIQIMKDGLKNNRFSVYFQPIYSVKDKKITSAEALVRLRNTELGFISPEEFIPVAEKNGLILEIGNFVFHSVCEFIALNNIWDYGIENIHINLSVIQCMQDKLCEQLCSIMDSYHLDYKYIRLEVTENAANASREMIKRNMEKLIERNVNFALDAYGTGYSNTTSLLKYPFNTVKIDKSMIWEAIENNKAKKVVQHTVAMFNEMGIKTIAVGIETKEMAALLMELNCDYLQGFLYSKPVNGQDFLMLIQQ